MFNLEVACLDKDEVRATVDAVAVIRRIIISACSTPGQIFSPERDVCDVNALRNLQRQFKKKVSLMVVILHSGKTGGTVVLGEFGCSGEYILPETGTVSETYKSDKYQG